MSPQLRAEPHDELCRVLVAEDDVLLRELLAEALRDTRLTVIEVASADEAKRYLQAGGGADLVFTDVEMPGSMDGIVLGRWVAKNFPDMSLILTSGAGASGAAELGVFIAKPYRIFAAAEMARKMVDAKRSEINER